MKKDSMLEKYQSYIMENGMAHIIYYHDGVKDILDPYSIPGYELLSDEFTAFLEEYRVLIPKKAPIVLELVGDQLSNEEKDIVDRTVWTHFCLSMTEMDKAVKKIICSSLLYLGFTLLSTLILYIFAQDSSDIVVNLAYLPFYFFGYRLLIYIFIEGKPAWKDRSWYRRLASMKLVFSENESRTLNDLDVKAISDETLSYEIEAEKAVVKNKMINEYLMEGGIASLGASVSSIEDIIRTPVMPKKEYLNDALTGYLCKSEPFLSIKDPIKLHISGCKFCKEEKETIEKAVKNYYGLRIASEEYSDRNNRSMIISFGSLMLIVGILLLLPGKVIDFGSHEIIVMLFCFFGDYLLEFILITHNDIKKVQKMLEGCRNMTIVYEDEEM